MTITGSYRVQQLRADLAKRFRLDEAAVSQGLVALVEAIRARLPRAVEVSLASWVPESWVVIAEAPEGIRPVAARSADEIKRRVAEAGVPFEVAGPFVVEVVRYLGDRCGSPLATALHRRVPEFAQLEQEVTSSLA
jgi:hypothetical protein